MVSNFIVQALRGEPITIYGDSAQTRSFCYVDDLVDALVRLMATPSEVTGPINLGNPTECSVRFLAELVLALTGSKSELVTRLLPQDDPRQRQPDIALARGALGWEPTTSLHEGLVRTIDYFRATLA